LEKLIKEHSDKIKESDRAPLEAAITKAREKAKGDDLDAIKSAIAELEAASHAVSKVMYEAGQQSASAQPEGAGAAAASGGKDDEAIDAEFEVKE
jgi:molecular chaperone DnaK